MCGIVGFISDKYSSEQASNIVTNMSSLLEHRGPDDRGSWLSSTARVALGHRRLSIHDLSSLGHQPMTSSNENYTVVFNGEIYNYKEIREELVKSGVKFRSDSDTEVLLAATEAFGPVQAARKFSGMFAYAIWSESEKVLWIFRDRVGEKPLYFSCIDNSFVFASELTALSSYPEVKKVINESVLSIYLRHGYIPAPHSIYEDIFKLRPGHYLQVKADSIGSKLDVEEFCYWDVNGRARANIEEPKEASNYVDELELLLSRSIQQQMSSDVPLGAFLSGGVDSSTVVAIMQSLSSSAIKTFSIGFDEEAFNEAHYAKQTADYLGTEHTELYVTNQMALDVVPSLFDIYDEPFADSSQIPTYLVSKLAKSQVTVSLSGDGGDELFHGYSRYERFIKQHGKLSSIPSKKLLGKSIKRLARLSGAQPDDRLSRVGIILAAANPLEHYLATISHFQRPEELLESKGALFSSPYELPTHILKNDLRDIAPYLDFGIYLPDDILVKLDRASMAVSLESRVPLLDYRIVEFAMGMPATIKNYDGKGKWPLRQLLYRYLPESMMDRPKRGFGIPIDDWIRNELREWAEELLGADQLSKHELFNSTKVRNLWKEHVSRKANHGSRLWNILMFQSWYNRHC
ncbi:asparagine synthase (glutamine-hydrolyzing) [Pleionea sp. CnH1-48]|uniref:asparagine synthase (glutamine-hydrolyzing) n=1 Tax=Pleionea sp. CnH1-48 TaxID=2954494 RepID=UPI002097F2DC|nr:asparagine synthase (glutamine-hydrolyzing) [Pleionea sp. CnH1-48]MCO7223794.1 asparagine synthase (glutamine-hydrolyzing) [Pleionea sp. CnH1-48]